MARILGITHLHGGAAEAAPAAAEELVRLSCDPVVSERYEIPGGSCLLVRRPTEPGRAYRDGTSGVLALVDGAPQLGGRLIDAADVVERFLDKGPSRFATDFDGGWAIVVADPRRGAVYLARDRIGLKPLYYAELSAGLAFASQAGSLVRAGWTARAYDAQVVAKYASSNYRMVYGGRPTFFRGVSLLPPATVLSHAAGITTEERYWELDPESGYLAATDSEVAGLYREELAAAVTRFTAPRDDSFAVSLSGGMDSASLLGMLHVVRGERVDAVSCTYREETQFDETSTIAPSVQAHARRWHDHEPTADELEDDLPTLYERFDLPLATVSQWVAESTRRALRALGYSAFYSGSGGDSLQGGTYPAYLYNLADLKASGDEAAYRHELACWIGNHGTPQYPKTPRTAEAFFDETIDFTVPGRLKPAVLPLSAIANLLEADFVADVSLAPLTVRPYGTYLRTYMMQDYWYEAIPSGPPTEDISGWVHGVEGVDPFFTLPLLELCWRIPNRQKIRDGVNKVIARLAMRGVVPDEILDNVSKQGWNAPSDQWFRGELRDQLLDITRSQSFRERGIYKPAAVESLVREHLGGHANHMMLLWQIVNLELWLREWIDH
jgi:asparagine synthase (glutamine-hydrolysing)